MLLKLFLNSLELDSELICSFCHKVLVGTGRLLAAAYATKLLCSASRWALTQVHSAGLNQLEATLDECGLTVSSVAFVTG